MIVFVSSFYQQKCNLKIKWTIGFSFLFFFFLVKFKTQKPFYLDAKWIEKSLREKNWIEKTKNGRERNCMNELAWTMEINRASNGQEVNVRVQVALNVRANLLLVLRLKPFKTIILQFVIRLATNSGFTFVFFLFSCVCFSHSLFFFSNFNSEWTWTWCTFATEAWQNKTKHACTWKEKNERDGGEREKKNA